MGEVYLAEDTALGRQVAVKFLAPKFAENPDARARFDREARAMAAVEHPNVVRLYAFGEVEELRRRYQVNGRLGAHILAVGRVAKAHQVRGVFP